MALFEYQCKENRCQGITTRLFFGSEEVPDNVYCEICGNVARRIISASAFFVKQGTCGNAESGYSDVRNTKPMDQKRDKSRAYHEASELNKGRNPR